MDKRAGIAAIIGRTNVGKSSLLNALAGKRQAIVAREAGTTRDRVSTKVSWRGKDFWLIDTAGMKTAEDEFELSIQNQISEAATSADVIIMVVESDIPVTAEDRRIAKVALKSGKPVILVINKIDKNPKAQPLDWRVLGVKPVLATSATQKMGTAELLEAISSHLPLARISETKSRIHLAILGRPNVGKSSLFNSLASKQQALIAPQAGTTRDVNRLVLRYKEREIELADTAGIRRPGRIEVGVEKFSVLRALAAIEKSDICLLLMDATELNTALDQKIAGLIKDAGKGLILVINKWDMIEDQISKDEVADQTANSFPFVPWAPLIFTSAVTGQNVTQIFDLVLEITKNRSLKISTPELNNWLRRTVDAHEPPLRRHLPKLNYIVQEDDADMPSFKVFGSHIKFLHFSYKRYLERQFRAQWPLTGVPLKFWFIEKRSPTKNLQHGSKS